MRVPRKCNSKCYQARVLRVLNNRHDEDESQAFYCLALEVESTLLLIILSLGITVLERYLAVTMTAHIVCHRFEPDMLAFSGCYYGGGEKERGNSAQSNMFILVRTAVMFAFTWHQVKTLAPLKALFPNFHSKETIASSHQGGAGTICSFFGWRYFGHRSTIRPNAKKMHKLFLDRNNMTWDEFASKVRTYQIGFMGEPKEVKPSRGEFHQIAAYNVEEDPDWTGIDYLDTGGLSKELPNADSSVLTKHGQWGEVRTYRRCFTRETATHSIRHPALPLSLKEMGMLLQTEATNVAEASSNLILRQFCMITSFKFRSL
ncbi:hypothetical protein F3Y22_tig00110893pilonHSYRG00368 [Hibiscus syriacus]|uniref:Uncharacterized protein n=1 Tax=Hibiscus syriacus TaxID=106335 RepID=A0A6A2ZID2_HIBSY|nr:hypothetical protein F3Y22_tig00110893pilonHSYRG00368 [Hibiscus syriacus]